MRNKILYKLFALSIILASNMMQSCDSGDIYPEEKTEDETNVDVTIKFKFSSINTFPNNYKVIFGSFKNDSPYPISSKVLSKPTEGQEVSVSLNNLSADADYLALYLIQEFSNTQIYPFYKYSLENQPKEDFDIPLQNIDLAPFGRIQHQVFSQCLQCHGGSGSAAAGLFLTEGNSYSHLVNVTAKNNAEKHLVTPNNAQNSFLMNILKGEALQNRHSSLSSLKDDDITLVEQWIENGAKNE